MGSGSPGGEYRDKDVESRPTPLWSLRSGSRSSSPLSLDARKRRVYIAVFALVFIAASVGAYLGTTLRGPAWIEVVFGYGLGAFAAILFLSAAFTRVSTDTLDRVVVTAAVILVPLRTAAFVLGTRETPLPELLSESSPWYGTVFILVFVMLDRRKAIFWSLLLYVELLVLGGVYLLRNSATLDSTKVNLAVQSLVLANASYIALLLFLTHTKEAYNKSADQQVRLAALAATDELTGIPNRRSFLSLCDHHIRGLGDAEADLAIIMLDVDRFKEVNDSHGHAIGDRVLQRVAAVIAENARDTDVYGRIGGEEFAILVPGTSIEIARIVAERLRTAIETDRAQDMPAVTASFGVAEWEEGDSTDSLMERADRALYHAKSDGRNRVSAMYEYQLPGSTPKPP